MSPWPKRYLGRRRARMMMMVSYFRKFNYNALLLRDLWLCSWDFGQKTDVSCGHPLLLFSSSAVESYVVRGFLRLLATKTSSMMSRISLLSAPQKWLLCWLLYWVCNCTCAQEAVQVLLLQNQENHWFKVQSWGSSLVFYNDVDEILLR